MKRPLISQPVFEGGRNPPCIGRLVPCTVGIFEKDSELRVAQFERIIEDGGDHLRKLALGPADDPQNLAKGAFPANRLFKAERQFGNERIPLLALGYADAGCPAEDIMQFDLR